MKTIIAVLILLLPATLTLAEIPEIAPDSFGLYFDGACTTSHISSETAFEPFELHLCLVNPTSTTGVSAWEGRVDIAGLVQNPSWTLSGGGVDQDPDISYFRVDVGLGPQALQPVADIVRLATLSGFAPSVLEPILFYIYPYPQPDRFIDAPGYYAGHDASEAILGASAAGLPYGSATSASINYLDCGCADNTVSTWGAVKTLFRQSS